MKYIIALGAAHLAAYAVGARQLNGLARLRKSDKIFSPAPDRAYYDRLYREYKNAVSRALMNP